MSPYETIATAKKYLARWKCHKQVDAAKIQQVVALNMAPGASLELEGARGETVAIVVSDDYMRKHDPKPGGYFVLYDDGYQSFSPAKAFEEGYTREAA